VERYQDAATNKYRMDIIVTGGGGAPLTGFQGTPKTSDYIKQFEKEKISLQHLVKPGPKPGDNPYHYCIVRVDGSKLDLEVVGIDWGRDFQPYRSSKVVLEEP
jgi:hypothetical protein